jgi:hypothetical protein
MRGHETLKNRPLTMLKGFSTVSAAIEPSDNNDFVAMWRRFSISGDD